MTTYKLGDIILVPFPFTDQTSTKKRPAVVISSEKYNSSRPDLIIMAITSRLYQMDKLGEKLVANWQVAGLIKPSVFNLFSPPLKTLWSLNSSELFRMTIITLSTKFFRISLE